MQLQSPLTLVTAALDGHVLTVLTRIDAWLTTPQIRASLSSFSDEGIRKVLRRLVEQGIVEAETVGRTSHYRLNRQHLAAAPLVALVDLDRELLRRLSAHVSAWHVAPIYASLFGSAAGGAMRPDSDIDIFLVSPDAADPDVWDQQTLELAGQVTLWTGNDARVLDMTESEVRHFGRDEPVVADIVAARHARFAGPPRWLGAAVG